MNPSQIIHNEKRVSELDGLRGIAILQVLVWHYFAEPVSPRSMPPVVHHLLGLTWSGVDLFFVLSGFLLGGILLDHKDSRDLFQVFYFRRACRILPLYYLWILAFAIIVFIAKAKAYEYPYISIFDLNIYHTIGLGHYLTFTQNFLMAANHDWGNQWFGVTWSLSVEEQFYLVLPLIIYFTPVRILKYVLLFLIVLAPILRTVLFFKLPLPNGVFWSFFSMPCRSDSLMLGVLSALAIRNMDFKKFIHQRVPILYAIAGALLGILFVMDFNGEGVCTGQMTWYGYTLLALFYTCVLLIAITEKNGGLTTIVRNPWLGQLGIISYGVYIFHQAIQSLVHAYFFHNDPQITGYATAWATFFALFLTLLMAWISWNYFEKPLVNFGHRWVYRKK